MNVISDFSGKYEFLSNFYPSRLKAKDYTFATVEHAFQAAKCLDAKQKEDIANAPTPGKAKRLGRKCSLRPDWEDVKVTVMKTLIELKFSDPKLRKKLLDTDDAMLIEGNTWHDNFWGDCLCVGCKNIPGHNILGNILMEVRDSMKDTGRSADETDHQ